MIPRQQCTAAALPLLSSTALSLRTQPCALVRTLAESLLAGDGGAARAICAHMSQAQHVRSFVDVARELRAITSTPLDLEVEQHCVALNKHWRVPLAALNRRELQCVLLLLHHAVFSQRTALVARKLHPRLVATLRSSAACSGALQRSFLGFVALRSVTAASCISQALLCL